MTQTETRPPLTRVAAVDQIIAEAPKPARHWVTPDQVTALTDRLTELGYRYQVIGIAYTDHRGHYYDDPAGTVRSALGPPPPDGPLGRLIRPIMDK